MALVVTMMMTTRSSLHQHQQPQEVSMLLIPTEIVP
jgi:hypothetical protein